MSKHTSGPWTIGTGTIRRGDGPEMVVIHGQGITLSECPAYVQEEREQRDANARLIAAAPEMLDALKAIVNNYDANELLIRWHDGQPANLDAARAAIARAEGR